MGDVDSAALAFERETGRCAEPLRGAVELCRVAVERALRAAAELLAGALEPF